MSNFHVLKVAVEKQFNMMAGHNLFRAQVDKDVLWNIYLDSFPPGTNPVFRQRREHDCSCCRQFIRAVGNAVAIIDRKKVSIWDCEINDPTYRAVAQAMAELVTSAPIENVFLHPEQSVGVNHNFDSTGGTVLTWEHFFVTIPFRRNQGKNYYCAGKDIGPKLSEARAQHDVLLRSLRELTLDATDTVLELIAQNSLYRGNEHKATVEAFKSLKRSFDMLPESKQDTFVWAMLEEVPGAVSKIRNTSIGTLLVDLSEGLDLEAAVRKFEAVVAPQNYKRPTALVTSAMVTKAKATIAELGLTSALERRYATLADVSVNNIIFANRTSRKAMKDDVFDNIPTKGSVPKNLSKVEQVSIATFIQDIVPHVESIEVMVENQHANNLVSLIAPVYSDSKPLFKWDNGFSWSYNGDVTDSIKERVKKAGGNITGDLCCRLAWYNYDDLDFHMREPDEYHIWFANKGDSRTAGRLDVDMNAFAGMTREPVENIYYGSRHRMKEGIYHLGVHNYRKRESDNVGFEVEVDFLGTVTRFVYPKAVRDQERITVYKFRYTHANGIEVIESLPSTSMAREIWGIRTQEFHNVTVLLYSPNHWDGHGVGNLHYFFMLDGCKNDGQARGFYNEFLRADLDKHRKVLEIVGSRMKTESSVNQLSGLGFSDTKHTELLVKVTGKITRMLRVMV
jgi:hypothetical protein